MRRRLKRLLEKRYDAKSVGTLSTWEIMRKAKRFNTLLNFRKAQQRKQAYKKDFANLIAENGIPQGKINKIENGYCIDDSQSLPYLQDLLADTDKIIAERGGVAKRKQKLRPFFRNIILPEDAENYPSILNFITSSEVITTVCHYTHDVPTLSNYTPEGIRLVESNIKYDDAPEKGYRGSQLFHQDPYDYKVVYVIVALKDITHECGPFSFFAEDISNQARQKLGYREKGCKYRVSDEEMYRVVDKKHLKKFCCPAGTVLFFDSSNCFHYGSRDCVVPRFMMMYALFSPCRADFDTIFHRNRKEYPVKKEDSRLRKMIIRHQGVLSPIKNWRILWYKFFVSGLASQRIFHLNCRNNTMLGKVVDRVFAPIARQLEHEPKRREKMSKLGIGNTMRLAKWYNTQLYGKYLRHREQQYANNFAELLKENGDVQEPVLEINDGWVLDTSRSLPYLQDVLDEADEIIKERGHKIESNNSYRAYFRNIITVGDLSTYPSFLNFITSSQVLATVCKYLKFIPCMPKDRPIGVRFAASSTSFDESAHLPPRDSQLFHIDPYCTHEVYVLVLLHDIRPDQGPFCFFPESLSQYAAKKLGYWTRKLPYRLSDELIYSVLDKKERRDFVYPKGSVLFIDPSRCFHYGSRDTQGTRYQLMYALANPCRTDFSETVVPKNFEFPIKDSDSRLRKMVLDKKFMIQKEIPLQRFTSSIYAKEQIPQDYHIGVLKGEGVGAHIIDCSLKLLTCLPQQFHITYGGAIGKLSEKECGKSLTSEVIDFCRDTFAKNGAILAGPGGSRFVYELRREFDLFCKVVPLMFYPEIQHANRLKDNFAQGTSITLLRENASGIYQGQETIDSSGEDEIWRMSFSYSKSEVQKILTVGAKIAQNSQKKMLVIVKDGGLCKFSKFWRKIAQQVADEYKIECDFANIDYATYYMIHYAQSLDVIVASNLFGDILADLGSVIMGGRGISFSGNFSQNNAAVYQTNHGSAYDLQGKNKANPVGQFYSLTMLLRESFHLEKEADWIEEAIRRAWKQGVWTFDVAPAGSPGVSTDEMAQCVYDHLQKIVEENS